MNSIDKFRRIHLAIAEAVDAWRLIPRAIVAGYGYLVYQVISWYMDLKPYILENCDVEKLGEACLVQAPTTQHAALVTAVVGIVAAVFGLYASTGRKWSEGVRSWESPEQSSWQAYRSRSIEQPSKECKTGEKEKED